MKIYFEDGMLVSNDSLEKSGVAAVMVDAEFGMSRFIEQMKARRFLEENEGRSYSIYTNCPLALDNKYAWNAKLGVPEVYLRDNTHYYKWVRIDELTDRELREGHNLLNLYLAGEFEN